MGRLAGNERTYALRFCGRVKLKDHDPCPTCGVPLGRFKYVPTSIDGAIGITIQPPRKSVEHKFLVPSEFGEDWVSISTVAHIIDKGGALSGWTFNLAIAGVLKLGTDVRGWTEEQLKEAMKQQGFTPWIKKDRAASRGKEVHEVLERLAEGETLEQVSEFIAAINIPKFMPEENREVQGYCLAAAHWFLAQDGIKPLLVERVVWSTQHRTVGTLDLYAERKTGHRYVLTDLKSSKDVYEDHPVQLDGYGICLDELIDKGELDLPKPNAHSIVLARPDGTYEERFVPSNPQSFVDALGLTRAVMDIRDYLKKNVGEGMKSSPPESAMAPSPAPGDKEVDAGE